MREVKPTLTPELEEHCKDIPIAQAAAFGVNTFRSLVEHVARLAYSNPDGLLFFRGQNRDYQSKRGATSLYPAIYRGDSLAARELRHRYDLLEQAAQLLVDRFKTANIDGYRELRRKRYIQWSILQHYEVIATPLLDITQSLRVACSFAQLHSTDPRCYVYVLALPYVTNRISINSEHDIVNVRLLSICPPAALRPYFQEGYLAGTTDITTEFDSKSELDFRNRLVAKFVIPRSKEFWGSGFNQIPETALMPKGDTIQNLCAGLRDQLRNELQPGDLGEFIKEWASLEEYLLGEARGLTERSVSVREAILILLNRNLIDKEQATLLDAIRKFRNTVVHQPQTVETEALQKWIDTVRLLIRRFRRQTN